MSGARAGRPPLLDLAIAAVLLVAAEVATATYPLAIAPFAEIGAVLVAGSIALRRIAPLTMTLAAAAGLLLLPRVDGVLWLLAAALIIGFSAGLRLPLGRLTFGVGVLLVAAILLQSRTSTPVESVVVPTILNVGPAAAGVLVARTRRQGERLRRLTERLRAATAERERLAATAERSRVSRDLHDILGSTLTTIVVQATAAGQLLPAGGAATGPVDSVAEAGREAMTEVRALLSLARRADGSEQEHRAPLQPPTAPGVRAVVSGVATVGLLAALSAVLARTLPGPPLWMFAGVLLLAFLSAALLPLRPGLICIALVLAAAATYPSDQPNLAGRLVSMLLLIGAPGLAGLLLGRARARSRALRELGERLAAEQERSAALVAAVERSKISRELHDVLAHTLGSIAVQAGAAQQLVPAGDRARDLIDSVAAGARDALAEVRALLSADGPGAATVQPGPSLMRLPELVAADGAALVVRGAEAPVETEVSLAAYRLVQEALTNARRHAPGHPATVVVEWDAAALRITVENGGSPQRSATGGHGLIGMRERVLACSGELDAGPRDDGTGWLVRAVLPLATVPA